MVRSPSERAGPSPLPPCYPTDHHAARMPATAPRRAPRGADGGVGGGEGPNEHAEALDSAGPMPCGALHRLGFVVNPVAGMGGRVGLKGTDGVVDQAIALGAEPSAHLRALEMLRELHSLLGEGSAVQVEWLTCGGRMGADWLALAGFDRVSVVHEPGARTGVEDTLAAVRRIVCDGVELVVFCGGDGTARDVCGVTGEATPLLGVPAGVKMFSGVFGVTPRHTARILYEHLLGRLESVQVEVLDIDEERYRHGEWAVRLFGTAITPFEPSYTQAAKALVTAAGDDEVREDIAEEVVERIGKQPGTLVLLGPGGTVEAVARRLGVDKTLLGVDAVVDGRRIAADLDETRLQRLLDAHERRLLVVSPIGAQGFVLGRGNQQLSAAALRRIGPANVVVIATPAKLARTATLRFDTGDAELDAAFAGAGYLPVVIGHHVSRLVGTTR